MLQRSPSRVFQAIAALLACCVLASCTSHESLLKREPHAAERTAIRGWLKKNLNDPSFEEIEWGPEIDGLSVKSEVLEHLKDRIQETSDGIAKLEERAKEAGRDRFQANLDYYGLWLKQYREDAAFVEKTTADFLLTHLKLRSRNTSGAQQVFEYVFRCDQGGAVAGYDVTDGAKVLDGNIRIVDMDPRVWEYQNQKEAHERVRPSLLDVQQEIYHLKRLTGSN